MQLQLTPWIVHLDNLGEIYIYLGTELMEVVQTRYIRNVFSKLTNLYNVIGSIDTNTSLQGKLMNVSSSVVPKC